MPKLLGLNFNVTNIYTIQNTTLLTRCKRKLLDVNSHNLFPAKVRAAVRSGKEIVWTCIYCADDDSIPIAESTRLDDFDIPPSLDTPSQRSTAEYDSRESLEDNRKFLFFFLYLVFR